MQGRLHLARCSSLHVLGRLQMMGDASRTALSLFGLAGDRTGGLRALSNIGAVFRLKGEPESALTQYRRALSVARETRDRESEGIALCNIGLLLKEEGGEGEAEEALRQALAIFRAAGAQGYTGLLEKELAGLETS